jgi:ATP synthase protein I
VREREGQIIRGGFGNVLKWQLIAGLVVGASCYVLSTVEAAISAVVGVSSVVAGSFGAMYVVRKGQSDPMAALLGVLKAEALKIFIIAVLLFASFKLYSGLVPIALIGGLAVAALISGAALKAFDDENKT